MNNLLDNNNVATLNPKFLIDLLKTISNEFKVLKWDMGASSSRDTSVQVQQGNAKQLKGSQRKSLTLRVWNKENKVGITSTSDLTKDGVKKAMKGAIESSYYGNKKESPEFSTLAKSPLNQIHSKQTKDHGINELLNILKNAEKKLIETHRSIDSVPYNGLSESFMERLYINSDGANRYMQLSQSTIYLYAKAQEENKKPRSAG